jgi:NDP-sugar pyrophosphorylase family protein
VHALVLAGGEGSRLAAEGIRVPKPLIPLAGRPLLLHVLEALAALECESLTVMVREDFLADVRDSLAAQPRPLRQAVTVAPCLTPTSAHTLVAGLGLVPPGPVFCTMVDSVMPPESWGAAYRGATAELDRGADAVLVVTPFLHDESPLFIERDRRGVVRGVGDRPGGEGRVVSGGVYAFGPEVRRLAGEALAAGVARMRGFLAWLIARGARVATVEIESIVDLDRAADWALADRWLSGEPLGGG